MYILFYNSIDISFTEVYRQALHSKEFKATKKVKNSGMYNTYHGTLSTDPCSYMSVNHSNGQYKIRVALTSSCNILWGRLYWLEPQHLSTIFRHAPEMKPHWKIIDAICLSLL